jgi:diaminopimelate epimerase
MTLACGTGAAAVAVAARQRGLVDDKVELLLPGGLLKLEWDGASDVYLTGPAVEVFEGEWPG